MKRRNWILYSGVSLGSAGTCPGIFVAIQLSSPETQLIAMVMQHNGGLWPMHYSDEIEIGILQ
jgi:hypothetical protein